VSLRVRLLLAVGAVALMALLAADVATYQALRRSLYSRIDQSLETTHVAVERVATDGHPEGPSFLAIAPDTYVEVRYSNGLVARSDAHLRGGGSVQPALGSRLNGLAQPTGSGAGDGEQPLYLTTGSVQQGGPQFRVRASILPNGNVLILGVPLTDTNATLHQLLVIELSVTAAALVVATALGWWLVQVGLRPLAAVEQTAVAIAGGQLDRRVPGDAANTEVGQVARALNTMLGRIEDAFAERDATEAELRLSEARMRRFVADASHELRTPLAAVAAYAELFQRGANKRPADLARVMAGIRVETGRMGQLVQDLLLLARLDEGRPLEQKPVELVALAAEAVDTAQAVGPEWPIHLEADAAVEVVGDRTRLRQVVDNLLANVRAHTPAGTTAAVRVSATNTDAVIEVADRGAGLTAEQASRVFERFYRADPSRSRQHGGAGLGLGIVAAIVAAHGGRVAATSPFEGGATFTVTLPLAARSRPSTAKAEATQPAGWGPASGSSDGPDADAPESSEARPLSQS
jgi:two-component system OmpR family sensor kinase